MTRALRIAMIGCRGVPATYGGIERHVEEVGARLVERGHEVTVFNRSGYAGEEASGEHRGMRVVVLPAVGTKHLEALSHSAFATVRAVRRRYDVYHFHALGPGLFASLARVAGRGCVVLTVHGLDFQRAKWNAAAAWCIRRAESVAVRSAHGLVVVAPELVEHYRSAFGIEATFIRNGVTARTPSSRAAADSVVLFVGRLTPEKGPHLLLEAFRRIADPHLRLVVVGGSSHTDDFVANLKRAARMDPRVDLRGYVFGQELTDLYASARLFVQPSSLEGMPLTVLEAAACKVPLLTSDIAVHREMLAPPGPGRRLFPTGSVDGLEAQLRSALGADAEQERSAARAFGEQVLLRHSWDDVAEELEEHYLRMVERTGRRRRGSVSVPREGTR